MSAPTTAVPAVLSRARALELVRLATLAPSGHNTQPWLFEVCEDAVVLRPDLSRRLPVVDPDDHALFISLGAALENLLIAAGERGLASEVEAFGAAEPDGLLVRLRPARPAEAVGEPGLAAAILERQSTRRTYDREARRTAEAVRSSSALALFATERNGRKGFVDLGRSLERLALAATALGLKHAHVNMACEVPPVRERLRAHLGPGHAQPLLPVRFGYTPARPRSLRRPVEDVPA
jgi:nitroreductase